MVCCAGTVVVARISLVTTGTAAHLDARFLVVGKQDVRRGEHFAFDSVAEYDDVRHAGIVGRDEGEVIAESFVGSTAKPLD